MKTIHKTKDFASSSLITHFVSVPSSSSYIMSIIALDIGLCFTSKNNRNADLVGRSISWVSNISTSIF